MLASGLGAQRPVTITSVISPGSDAHKFLCSVTFTYDRPEIRIATPRIIPSLASRTWPAYLGAVTLRGANFGVLRPDSAKAFVASTACQTTHWISDSSVVCDAEPGSAVEIGEAAHTVSLLLEARSGVSLPDAVQFKYESLVSPSIVTDLATAGFTTEMRVRTFLPGQLPADGRIRVQIDGDIMPSSPVLAKIVSGMDGDINAQLADPFKGCNFTTLRSNQTVCVLTDVCSTPIHGECPHGACSGKKAYTEAAAFCEAAGARVCTVEELQHVNWSLPCTESTTQFWTSDLCNNVSIFANSSRKTLSMGPLGVKWNQNCSEDIDFNDVVCCSATLPNQEVVINRFGGSQSPGGQLVEIEITVQMPFKSQQLSVASIITTTHNGVRLYFADTAIADVLPGKTTLDSTLVQFEGQYPTDRRSVAGVATRVVVQTRDRYGNERTSPLDQDVSFVAVLTGFSLGTTLVTDIGDGTLHVDFSATTAGE